ncbi:MAG: TetR/AcrR family transcriptional regulator, partial [Actinomycetia bacterium]|nr:TetR/AcrR family transcriptional regulator [Actinomycetes bacterium]
MDPKTRKPRAARREQIVQAVLTVIDEQGVTALTTTILAKQIGVTSGALFRHFETRDEILQETVRYVAARIDRTFPDYSLPAVERLRLLIENR